MANVGLDFGTTYTSCFLWDETEQKFKNLLSQDPKNRAQASLVLYVGGHPLYGNRAVTNLLAHTLDDQKNRIFSGFKMLLHDNDQLKDRGYDENGAFCPKEITKSYLKEMIKIAAQKAKNKIGKIVIGIPVLWKDDKSTLKGYEVLKEILSEILKELPGIIDDYQFYSEPELACAYFAWNYREKMIKEKSKNPDFNGFMQVIDYGGGTLDINFCKVSQRSGNCEITVSLGGGDGENDRQKGMLGKAGLAYIENVVKKIAEDKYKNITNQEKYKLLQTLESNLIEGKQDIDNNFDLARSKKEKDRINKLHFDPIGIMDNPITYGHLYEVFMETFGDEDMSNKNGERDDNKVLVKALNELEHKKRILRKTDDTLPNINDDFKLALTGGFCDFFLTKQAIYDYYEVGSPDDKKIKGMDMEEEGSRFAIALGAALVAAGKVKINKINPFTLGIQKEEKNGTQKRWVAFQYGKDMEPEKPKYVLDPNENLEVIFQGSDIATLFYDSDGSGKYEAKMVNDEYKNLFKVPGNPLKDIYLIGFSINEKEDLKLHFQKVREISINEHEKVGEPISIELPKLHQLLRDPLEAVGVFKEKI